MPRNCRVCSHTKRQEIEVALLSSQSVREISALFRVSEDSLQRHKQSHLSDKLAKAHEAKEVLDAHSLLREMSELRDKLSRGLDAAEQSGSAGGVVAFGRELRNTLEAYFKITDRMAERATESGEPELMRFQIVEIGAPDECPHCGKPVKPVETVTNDYTCPKAYR